MPKQNPFSLYDFLGYFVPGAVFLYVLDVLVTHAKVTGIAKDLLDFDPKVASEYLPFLLAAYVVGHIVSFASSVTIERFSIWQLGYPSKYLLGVPAPKYFARDRLVRGLVLVFVSPIAALDYLLGRGVGFRQFYADGLDILLTGVIRGKLNRLLRDQAEAGARPDSHREDAVDFFRYAYHYAVENAPNHFPKMQNYVALYGFLRTLAFIGLIVFWLSFVHVFTHTISYLHIGLWLVGASAVTYVLFMAFQKFYRRFSLEALMAMAVAYPLPAKASKS